MRYRIAHRTEYVYSENASLSQNELFLFPRETPGQHVYESNVTIDPEPQYLNKWVDYFGNVVQMFMVQHPHRILSLEAVSVVETFVRPLPQARETLPWEQTATRLASHMHQDELDAYQFVFPSSMTADSNDISIYAAASFEPGVPVLQGAMHLMNRIFSEFTYDADATSVDTPVSQVLSQKKGVCQDFAHLMISCLRTHGLAARYVSGYLETKPPPGRKKLVGADASHAWVALYVPDFGWVDLDPTNNLMPEESHITLAWGRDYADVTPVKGVVMGGGTHTLAVSVDVRPDPSPTPAPGH